MQNHVKNILNLLHLKSAKDVEDWFGGGKLKVFLSY